MSISMHQANPQFNFGQVTSQAIQQQRSLNMENKLIDLVKRPMVEMEIEKYNQQKVNDEFMKDYLLSISDRRQISGELEEGLSEIEGQWFRPNKLGWNPFSWFMDSEEDQKEALIEDYRDKYQDQFDPRALLENFQGGSVSSPVIEAMLNTSQIDRFTPTGDYVQLLNNMNTMQGGY